MKRKTGASAVVVVALIVVILACVGIIVYWTAGKGPPAPPETATGLAQDTVGVQCFAQGCDWKGWWPRTGMSAKEKGKGLKGLELYKCPTCGKLSVAEPGQHPQLEAGR